MSNEERLLFIDDSTSDVAIIVAHLERVAGGPLRFERAGALRDFEAALRDFRPTSVLADHGVPGFESIDALNHLRASGRPIPFIVVTGSLDDRSAVMYMQAGADDIVLKSGLERLPSALSGARARRAGLDALSPRQLEVLRRVALGQTTPQMAQELGISAKTVDTHRTALMRRLDIHHVAGLVRYALHVGLVPPGV